MADISLGSGTEVVHVPAELAVCSTARAVANEIEIGLVAGLDATEEC